MKRNELAIFIKKYDMDCESCIHSCHAQTKEYGDICFKYHASFIPDLVKLIVWTDDNTLDHNFRWGKVLL